MQSETKNEKTFTMVFTETEALILASMVQNPIVENETQEQRKLREDIFHVVHPKPITR